MVAQSCCRLAKGNDFGVSGRIVIHQIPVEPACDKLSILDDYSTHGYLAGRESKSRLLKRKLHPRRIIIGERGAVIF
jgi:hypothetical protein